MMPPLEIERKYLISKLAVDDIKKHAEKERTYLMGYICTGDVEARIKSTTCKGPYHLTFKSSGGLTRTEIPIEVTNGEVADQLWSLVGAKTVEKTRYYVGRWEIDIFISHKGLILVEIELYYEDEQVEMPEWLSPYLVRDVTFEDCYKGKNLAQLNNRTIRNWI